VAGVFGQHTPGVARLGGFPGGFAFLYFGGGDFQRQEAFFRVDGDGVAIFDKGDRPAHVGLGGDVANDKAVAAAGEPAVSNEGDVLAQALAHDGGGGGEHFAHAGTAAGSLVADDDDITFDNGAIEDGGHGEFLGVEDAGAAGELQTFLAGDFGHGPLDGQVAAQNDEVAVLFNGLVQRPDDGLMRGVGGHIGQRIGNGFAGDGEGIAMQEAGVEEGFHERPDAADGDEFGHQMFAAGFQIGEHGHAFANAGEVVEGQFHLGGMRDGEQMEDGIGGTAEGDDDGDGVFKGLFREDGAGAQTGFKHLEDDGAGAAAVFEFGWGNGVLGGAVGQAHAEGLDGGGHGVGGVHAAAGAGARDGALLNGQEFGVGDFVIGVRADGLEDRDDVELAGVAGDAAGQNGAAINKDRGAVQAGDGDHGAGHVFIAAADGHKAIHAGATHDGLDGVGDDFAGDEGIFHSLGAHGNAVGNGDGIENDGFATRSIRPGLGFTGELVNVHVAGRDITPGGGDPDEGFFEILGLESHGIQHGARGGALIPVEQDAGKRTLRIGHGFFHVAVNLPVGGAFGKWLEF